MALTLRYVEDREEVAHQYARTLLGAFAADPYIEDALQLTRDLVTESMNDVRTFEGGGGEPNQRRPAAADQPCMGRTGRLSRTSYPPEAPGST